MPNYEESVKETVAQTRRDDFAVLFFR